MGNIRVLLLSVGLAWSGGTQACQPPISLHLGGPRPEVDLTIAGKTRRAVFDTGAMYTVVNITTFSELGVSRTGPLLPPFNRMHAADGFQGRMETAKIGPVTVAAQSVPVMPVPLPTPAIISPNIFGNQLVRLDFGAGVMTVCPATRKNLPPGRPHPYSALPFALPSIPINIGGTIVDAHLDTGSPVNLILPMAYAKRVPLDGELTEVGRAGRHQGQFPIYRGRIKGEVRIGPLVLNNPDVRFSDVVPNANVGTALLKQLRITLNPAAKLLWAEAAGTADPRETKIH